MSDELTTSSVMRLLAGDSEIADEIRAERRRGITTGPAPKPKCNARGILLDNHVPDQARRTCTRCRKTLPRRRAA